MTTFAFIAPDETSTRRSLGGVRGDGDAPLAVDGDAGFRAAADLQSTSARVAQPWRPRRRP